jgi:hypothetical protein
MRLAPEAVGDRAGGCDKAMNYEVGALGAQEFEAGGRWAAPRCCAAATPQGRALS